MFLAAQWTVPWKIGRVQLKCDGTRWRTGGVVKWKLANAVGSQYPSHYLGTWCTQHYYSWCAHLGCQQPTELTLTGRFKWTSPFRTKDEIWFLRMCHHISIGLYYSHFRQGQLLRHITATQIDKESLGCSLKDIHKQSADICNACSIKKYDHCATRCFFASVSSVSSYINGNDRGSLTTVELRLGAGVTTHQGQFYPF